MTEPVRVWLIDRKTLRGPWPALATLEPHKNGTPGAWAVLVSFEPLPADLVDKFRGRPSTYQFPLKRRYAIGSRVFLTELAAKRFLEGEADRYLNAPSCSWMRRFHPDSMVISRALHLAPPPVYKGNRK
jgi:hypothetical protein